MKLQVVWTSAATRGFDGLPESLRERIYSALAPLACDGVGDVRPLLGQPGVFRLRVGDYRILYTVRGGDLILLRVSRRDHAY